MIVFLYRPSPQVPVPSIRAVRHCITASVYNINMQSNQIASKSVDLTWIFTQSIFMALNTILWAISYPEIRQEHPKEEIEKSVTIAQEAIYLASKRWPGVESALELYHNLVTACLKSYDGSGETSCVVDTASNKTSPASLRDAITPPLLPSPLAPSSTSFYDQVVPLASSTGYFPDHTSLCGRPNVFPAPLDYNTKNTFSYRNFSVLDPVMSRSYRGPDIQKPARSLTSPFNITDDDPTSVFRGFPRKLPDFQSSLVVQGDHEEYLGSIGDQFSHFLHTPYMDQQPLKTLNFEQQLELMNTLENDGLDWG